MCNFIFAGHVVTTGNPVFGSDIIIRKEKG